MVIAFIRLIRVGIVYLTMLAFLMVVGACGTGADLESAASPETKAATEAVPMPETTAIPETTVEKEGATAEETQERALEGCPGVGEAFVQDAQWYAEDYNLSKEEAIRRMRISECFSRDLTDLERKLMREERDSFAGFWLEHEPEYRFVYLFTEDGPEKLQPYIKDEPYAPLLEARSYAEVSFAELKTAQRKAGRIVDRLDFRADLSIDIVKNHAEIFVTDRDKFRAELRKAGLRLPEHVALIEVEGLSRPAVRQ